MSEEVTRNEEMGEGEDDILTSLVGEGRKFKSVTDLAKGKLESDAFINKLQDENKALRALINNEEDRQRSTKVMQELLDKISKSTIQREHTEATPSGEARNQPDSLTAKDVEELYKVMRQREREEENERKALSRVEEKYKEKTEDYLKSKAAELGLDIGMLRETARRSPAAFWNLVGENTSNVPRGPKSSVNSEAVIEMNRDNIRNRAYYDKLKKEMGIKAFVTDSRIQVQMHKDMMALGSAWDAD